MKKENIIIGAIAVIGLLTLFNTYSIITSDDGRSIKPLDSRVATQPTNNAGANFPSTLPQQNQPQNQQNQPQPMQQGMPDIPKTGSSIVIPAIAP